jgi:glycosyltransferase involved in cell wall biosynthesis
MRWESRLKLSKQFIEHMLDSGVDLTVVETAYGERPFELDTIPHIRHIPTRARTMAWGKESALNVGIRALPPAARYVAWIDADCEFRNPDFAAETVHQLQMQPVVQPWSEAIDMGPKGEALNVKGKDIQRSFAWVWRTTGDVQNWWKKEKAGEPYHYPHSGYAWAARMDFLDKTGLLLDRSGLGAADHQMSLGMVGLANSAIHGLSTPAYSAYVKAWGDRAFAACQGHIGFVQGRLEHHYHGPKANRLYVERWDILNKHAFDPVTDLVINRWGILELANNKPEMRRDFDRYFAQRDEDSR